MKGVSMKLTNHVEDEIKLVTVVSPRKQWPSCQEFCKDTTDCPDIDCLTIVDQGGGNSITNEELPSCTS